MTTKNKQRAKRAQQTTTEYLQHYNIQHNLDNLNQTISDAHNQKHSIKLLENI